MKTLTLDPDPDTAHAITTSHPLQIPAHAAIHMMPTYANLREKSPQALRKSATKTTTDDPQNPANLPPTDAARPAHDPGPQAFNSATTFLTQPKPQLQLQLQTHHNTPRPHLHHEAHLATGTMPI